MQALFNNFRAAPTEANANKIRKHLKKYPMSVCFLDLGEIKFLRDNGISV